MALFNLFGGKKPQVKKTVPVKVTSIRSTPAQTGEDAYNFRGNVQEYFADLLKRHFGAYEVRRGVKVNDLLGGAVSGASVGSSSAASWKCGCGIENKGSFCVECGVKKPEPKPAPVSGPWVCGCGSSNTGKFCPECGSPRPVSKEWTCACGNVNEGRFCPECGAKKPEAPKAVRTVPVAVKAPAAAAVPEVKGGYIPLSFVLYQGGKAKLAIILCPKNSYDHRSIRNTIALCEKSGIPCQRYFNEFRNDSVYVRDRISKALR